MRSEIVGAQLQIIAQDKEVAETLFELLEAQQILEGEADITILPQGSRQDLLTQLSVMRGDPPPPPPPRR